MILVIISVEKHFMECSEKPVEALQMAQLLVTVEKRVMKHPILKSLLMVVLITGG